MAASMPLLSAVYFRSLLTVAILLWPVGVLGQTSASDNVVVRWNAAALQGVRDSRIGPPMVARALAIVHTCIFDAWPAYDKRAVGRMFGAELRGRKSARTFGKKHESMNFAAY